uniref:Uncharacterized protein n=1 Tax=Toxoplasma gondii COUG TaxID=1074873 RepID=A0A2G8Y2S4_TOXGO|nr:hypothetical protein TGCOUG_271770 [Toxoplasma gondii COUG]
MTPGRRLESGGHGWTKGGTMKDAQSGPRSRERQVLQRATGGGRMREDVGSYPLGMSARCARPARQLFSPSPSYSLHFLLLLLLIGPLSLCSNVTRDVSPRSPASSHSAASPTSTPSKPPSPPCFSTLFNLWFGSSSLPYSSFRTFVSFSFHGPSQRLSLLPYLAPEPSTLGLSKAPHPSNILALVFEFSVFPFLRFLFGFRSATVSSSAPLVFGDCVSLFRRMKERLRRRQPTQPSEANLAQALTDEYDEAGEQQPWLDAQLHLESDPYSYTDPDEDFDAEYYQEEYPYTEARLPAVPSQRPAELRRTPAEIATFFPGERPPPEPSTNSPEYPGIIPVMPHASHPAPQVQIHHDTPRSVGTSAPTQEVVEHPKSEPTETHNWGICLPTHHTVFSSFATKYHVNVADTSPEDLGAFRLAVCAYEYLRASVTLWDIFVKGTASTSNPFFLSYSDFKALLRPNAPRPTSGQEPRENRLFLPAQDGAVVLPVVRHVLEKYEHLSSEGVQRMVYKLVKFLNKKAFFLLPSVIVRVADWMPVFDGMALASEETKTRYKEFLSRYTYRAIDSTNPSSPLYAADSEFLKRHANNLIPTYADPTTPREASWLHCMLQEASAPAHAWTPEPDFMNHFLLVKHAHEDIRMTTVWIKRLSKHPPPKTSTPSNASPQAFPAVSPPGGQPQADRLQPEKEGGSLAQRGDSVLSKPMSVQASRAHQRDASGADSEAAKVEHESAAHTDKSGKQPHTCPYRENLPQTPEEQRALFREFAETFKSLDDDKRQTRETVVFSAARLIRAIQAAQIGQAYGDTCDLTVALMHAGQGAGAANAMADYLDQVEETLKEISVAERELQRLSSEYKNLVADEERKQAAARKHKKQEASHPRHSETPSFGHEPSGHHPSSFMFISASAPASTSALSAPPSSSLSHHSSSSPSAASKSPVSFVHRYEQSSLDASIDSWGDNSPFVSFAPSVPSSSAFSTSALPPSSFASVYSSSPSRALFPVASSRHYFTLSTFQPAASPGSSSWSVTPSGSSFPYSFLLVHADREASDSTSASKQPKRRASKKAKTKMRKMQNKQRSSLYNVVEKGADYLLYLQQADGVDLPTMHRIVACKNENSDQPLDPAFQEAIFQRIRERFRQGEERQKLESLKELRLSLVRSLQHVPLSRQTKADYETVEKACENTATAISGQGFYSLSFADRQRLLRHRFTGSRRAPLSEDEADRLKLPLKIIPRLAHAIDKEEADGFTRLFRDIYRRLGTHIHALAEDRTVGEGKPHVDSKALTEIENSIRSLESEKTAALARHIVKEAEQSISLPPDTAAWLAYIGLRSQLADLLQKFLRLPQVKAQKKDSAHQSLSREVARVLTHACIGKAKVGRILAAMEQDPSVHEILRQQKGIELSLLLFKRHVARSARALDPLEAKKCKEQHPHLGMLSDAMRDERRRRSNEHVPRPCPATPQEDRVLVKMENQLAASVARHAFDKMPKAAIEMLLENLEVEHYQEAVDGLIRALSDRYAAHVARQGEQIDLGRKKRKNQNDSRTFTAYKKLETWIRSRIPDSLQVAALRSLEPHIRHKAASFLLISRLLPLSRQWLSLDDRIFSAAGVTFLSVFRDQQAAFSGSIYSTLVMRFPLFSPQRAWLLYGYGWYLLSAHVPEAEKQALKTEVAERIFSLKRALSLDEAKAREQPHSGKRKRRKSKNAETQVASRQAEDEKKALEELKGSEELFKILFATSAESLASTLPSYKCRRLFSFSTFFTFYQSRVHSLQQMLISGGQAESTKTGGQEQMSNIKQWMKEQKTVVKEAATLSRVFAAGLFVESFWPEVLNRALHEYPFDEKNRAEAAERLYHFLLAIYREEFSSNSGDVHGTAGAKLYRLALRYSTAPDQQNLVSAAVRVLKEAKLEINEVKDFFVGQHAFLDAVAHAINGQVTGARQLLNIRDKMLHDAAAGLLSSPGEATHALRAALDAAGLQLTAKSQRALARLPHYSTLHQWGDALRNTKLRLKGPSKVTAKSQRQKSKFVSPHPDPSSPSSSTETSSGGSENQVSDEHHVTVRTTEAVTLLMHALETHALEVDFVWILDKEPISRKKLKSSILFDGPEESSYQLADAEEIKGETEGKEETQGQPVRVEGALLTFRPAGGEQADNDGILVMLRHSTAHTKSQPLPDVAGTCRLIRRAFTLFVRRFTFPQPRTTVSLSFLKLAPDVTPPTNIDEVVIYPEDLVRTRWTVQRVMGRDDEAADLKGLQLRELGGIKKTILLLSLQFHSRQ